MDAEARAAAAHMDAQLRAPFPADQLEWRITRAGWTDKGPWAQIVPYVTARGVQDRLTEVFGAFGWELHFSLFPSAQPGVLATLRCLFPQGWVERQDGAEQTATEPVKGGFSGAMKRVAVQFGIGRYLYGIGTTYADVSLEKQPGWTYQRDKEHGVFYWRPPAALLDQLTGGTAGAVEAQGHDSPAPKGHSHPAGMSGTDAKAPAIGRPTAPAGSGPVMPFGKTKGTPLAQLPVKDVESALAWAQSKGKFTEFQAEAAAFLNSQPGSFAETPAGLAEEGPEDDLPF